MTRLPRSGREALQAPRPRPRADPGARGGTGRKIASTSGTAPCDLRPVEPLAGCWRVITKWADGPGWAGRTRSITCSAWTTRTREGHARSGGGAWMGASTTSKRSMPRPACRSRQRTALTSSCTRTLTTDECQPQERASPPLMRRTIQLSRLNFYQRPCQ
jgi:hypothetical protein